MMTSSSPEQRISRHCSDDWVTLSDALLQGLVHALNNRVAALSAYVELASFGDDEGEYREMLPSEITQLHLVNGLFALLPGRGSEPEALELPLVLDDALRLHEHHPRLRGVPAVVQREGTPLPVRAPRWALLRALVMLVHTAKRAGDTVVGRGGAPLRVVGEPASVAVHVETSVEPSTDLVALADLCGGTVAHEGYELVFRLPSILELRRRERGDG